MNPKYFHDVSDAIFMTSRPRFYDRTSWKRSSHPASATEIGLRVRTIPRLMLSCRPARAQDRRLCKSELRPANLSPAAAYTSGSMASPPVGADYEGGEFLTKP